MASGCQKRKMTSLTRWSIYVTSEVALAVFGFVAKWIFMDGADFTEVILVPELCR